MRFIPCQEAAVCAEDSGVCQGAAMGVGLRSVAAGLCVSNSLEMLSDARAAIVIARRIGIGKIRNLDVSLLLVQQKACETRNAFDQSAW